MTFSVCCLKYVFFSGGMARIIIKARINIDHLTVKGFYIIFKLLCFCNISMLCWTITLVSLFEGCSH